MDGFENITDHVISDYAREFGERKLNRIIDRIDRSKKIHRFIERSKKDRDVPTHNVLPMVMEIPWFSFARGETLLLATSIVMRLWNNKCNQNYELIDDYSLGIKMRAVFREIGQMTHGR